MVDSKAGRSLIVIVCSSAFAQLGVHLSGSPDLTLAGGDAEPTQRVNGHVAIIASPPNARYAPLHAGGPRTFGAVRALVFPLGPETTDKARPQILAQMHGSTVMFVLAHRGICTSALTSKQPHI